MYDANCPRTLTEVTKNLLETLVKFADFGTGILVGSQNSHISPEFHFSRILKNSGYGLPEFLLRFRKFSKLLT